MNLVAGLLNAGVDGYSALQTRNYGVRARAGVPVLGLSGGVDWKIPMALQHLVLQRVLALQVDLFYLMARSNWITSEADLQRYVPRHSSFMQRLARWFAPAF